MAHGCSSFLLPGLDICLFRDEANKASPNKRPREDVRLLDEDLTDTVEQARGADNADSEPTNMTPVESAPIQVKHRVLPCLHH